MRLYVVAGAFLRVAGPVGEGRHVETDQRVWQH
jgi:hypothetical protein